MNLFMEPQKCPLPMTGPAPQGRAGSEGPMETLQGLAESPRADSVGASPAPMWKLAYTVVSDTHKALGSKRAPA